MESRSAFGLDLLIETRYSVLMYPRGLKRNDVVTTLMKELEVYRVILDPIDPDMLINPEVDFIVFSRSVAITGDICPGGAIIVLSTWGDKPVTDKRFKTHKYISREDLDVSWEVIPVPLTQQQLLYYDHLSTAGITDKLHSVSLFVGSHEMMAGYLQSKTNIIVPGPGVLPANAKIADHSGKISLLDQKITDGDLIFTSHPHLVDSFLHSCPRTLISGTDGREFTTSRIHLLDSWSITKIRDLLSVIRSKDTLKLILYIGHHPHVTSVDAIAYGELADRLGEIDSVYLQGRDSQLVDLSR